MSLPECAPTCVSVCLRMCMHPCMRLCLASPDQVSVGQEDPSGLGLGLGVVLGLVLGFRVPLLLCKLEG